MLMTPSYISTIQSTMSKIEEVMTDIKNWMVKKRLKLNDDKTECMLIGTKKTLKNYEVSTCNDWNIKY